MVVGATYAARVVGGVVAGTVVTVVTGARTVVGMAASGARSPAATERGFEALSAPAPAGRTAAADSAGGALTDTPASAGADCGALPM